MNVLRLETLSTTFVHLCTVFDSAHHTITLKRNAFNLRMLQERDINPVFNSQWHFVDAKLPSPRVRPLGCPWHERVMADIPALSLALSLALTLALSSALSVALSLALSLAL